ncbi:acyl-CoA thioesterase [Noviherbaspirillum sedimenti]|uniref:Thioesterase n=1 Tax=Noviherbaspirillum sedimenti TaxID=2320865 RepID=A0A3A3GQM1_9BURK|nr:thioesterase family protein [Noviherbaspirillum sedimenti]RJG03280.1 thioesterase [Noviherbaspirillum sedimenti]
MTRIQIELPEHFAFATEIPLYFHHINSGGHLDNALLLSLVSEARVRYFKTQGSQELDAIGLIMIVADAAVQYKSEAFYGEVMVVEMTPMHFHRKGFDLVYRMCDKASGREVARGKSGMLCFDHGLRKTAPMPESFVQRMAATAVADQRPPAEAARR